MALRLPDEFFSSTASTACSISSPSSNDGLRVAGRGATATVRRSEEDVDEVLKEIKFLNGSESLETAFKTEIRALKKLGHHMNIVNYKGKIEKNDRGIIRLEAHDQSLDGIARPLCECNITFVMVSLLKALQHCKQHGVIHGDVKSPNVLVSNLTRTCSGDSCNTTRGQEQEESAEPTNDHQCGAPKVVLADFGSSIIREEEEDEKCRIEIRCPWGTRSFLAPECVTLKHFSHASDVWAAGITLFMLLKGVLPNTNVESYGELTNEELQSKFSTEVENLDGPSNSCKELLNALLTVDPDTRITSEAALLHTWCND
eukprot:Selendium_serpulae@DN2448_c0_g1_i1.p1